jgi:hypothetical protein
MTIDEKLGDFVGSIAVAITDSPDNYSALGGWTYETHMADLKGLWREIFPQLKRDVEQARFIDGKLQEMFHAFEGGDRERGRDAALAIYNLGVRKLR